MASVAIEAFNQTFDVIHVTTSTVCCQGSPGTLGHPAIYLPLKDGIAVCPYCSRTYSQTPSDTL